MASKLHVVHAPLPGSFTTIHSKADNYTNLKVCFCEIPNRMYEIEMKRWELCLKIICFYSSSLPNISIDRM